jgi:2-isopropylmalate synthase
MHRLIYDWNGRAVKPPSGVMLDDETLRDGLQSPSVRCPDIGEKLKILHLIDRLGIDTADIGLPGAGPHVVRDVERLAREIVDQRLKVRPNCAARTVVADIRPSAPAWPWSAAPSSGRAPCGTTPKGGRSTGC